MHLSRRRFSVMLAALPATTLLPIRLRAEPSRDALSARLSEIEAGLGARLGVSILDTGSGKRWEHRASERFPLCSTFKALGAAAVLARVDTGEESLERRVRFAASDLVTYSPVTETQAGGAGMTMAEICHAAVTRSDNTAGNLILKSLDGPAGFTRFLRSIGDAQTRLDRWETELNDVPPGDPRDTTTPAAMTDSLARVVLGDVLSPASRDTLSGWLVANTTGDKRLRAGLPKTWRVGDKTGTGDRGVANDVAVIWPPTGAPVVASVYIADTTASLDARNAAFADVAAGLTEALKG